jgi:hypothetical protein
MNPFDGKGAAPRERRDDVFYVDPIGAGKRVKMLVYSPQVWGVWTHYHDATTPCYEDNNHCVNGHDPDTLRWKGYVLGHNHDRHKATFVQLTDGCYWQLNELFPTGVTLAGKMIFFSRTAKKNGRIHVSVEEYQQRSPSDCPRDVDPRASLYNLWQIPDPGWKWTLKPVFRISTGEGGNSAAAS